MIPVVISGGSGTRLWPVSRQAFPKQFCDLLDESLYTKTLKRLMPLGSPWTVTVQALNVLTDRAVKELGIPSEQVILEPMGRNTAPALALLCHVLQQKGKHNQVVAIFPADHLIENETAFHAAMKLGEQKALAGSVVTLGVKPTYPATGYGYIETDTAQNSKDGALRAIRFREKPDLETAKKFVAAGNYYWNAGMFIFKLETMIELFKKHLPEIWSVVTQVKPDLSNLNEIYEKVPKQSIDYGIMEKLPEHVCIPCQFEWNDIGSWDALSEVMQTQDYGHNPDSVVDMGERNFVFPVEGKTYGLVGVKDVIVVDTQDALLITKKGESEKVKEVVDRLKKQGATTADQHMFEIRPWGQFEVLNGDANFKSKKITVDAGAQLSLQSHTKRAELWIIVAGEGEVVLNDQVIPVKGGQHIYIPLGAKHRMRNTGKAALEFIEFQLGTYFGEDDITRYQDDYKRV